MTFKRVETYPQFFHILIRGGEIMLEELRKHYTENEIEMAFDEWLDDAANYEPTAKDVAIVAAAMIVPVILVAGGVMAVGAIYDKVSEKKEKKATN
jgi:hypothetical protein